MLLFHEALPLVLGLSYILYSSLSLLTPHDRAALPTEGAVSQNEVNEHDSSESGGRAGSCSPTSFPPLPDSQRRIDIAGHHCCTLDS